MSFVSPHHGSRGRLIAVALRGAAFVAGAFAAVFGCADYPLPPTDCDDRCVAEQRADCSGDDPVDCVRACEAERAERDARACSAVFHAESACLRAAPAGDFTCDGELSQPTVACLAERRAFFACMAPAGGPCFDLCQLEAAACGDGLRDCEAACLDLDASCEPPATAYYACAIASPLECGSEATPATDGAEPPCFDQALEFLHCVGY